MNPAVGTTPHAPRAAMDEELLLWRRWRDAGDRAARDHLLARYADYARVVAATFYARRIHDAVEFDDYAQYAQIGMLESFERFDPEQGVLFKSFASRRIQGAILDGLERSTERQQQVAAQRRLGAERKESVIDAHTALDDKPAQSRTPEQVLRYVADIGIGLALSWMLEGTGMVEDEERMVAMPFYRSAEMLQTRRRLLELVRNLPAQQSKVIAAHYLQEIPFDQIAKSMGLTKGRISQIHRQALDNLRVLLGSHPACDVGW